MKKLCLNLIVRVSSWLNYERTLCGVIVGMTLLYHSILFPWSHSTIEVFIGLGIATVFVVAHANKINALPPKQSQTRMIKK